MAVMETIMFNYVEEKQTVFTEVNANTLSMQDDRRKIININFN
jgi:hypothetical protein